MELPKADAAALLRLAEELGVAHNDYVVVADGSGSTNTEPCGWYASLLSVATARAVGCLGGAGQGTNNYAELAPFCHALWVIESWRYDWKPNLARPSVGLVSDSELTVHCGNGKYRRGKNLSLWATVDWFEQAGYKLTWKHVPRNSNAYNEAADFMANVGRRAIASCLRGKAA